MNYRHFFHAGNFADIFKHLVLSLSVDYLQNKEKGLFFLDAFAGCGIYSLESEKASKTREYESGIAALMNADFTNCDLMAFQALLKSFWTSSFYPGSPLLIAEKLRAQDRLCANELHPEDMEALKAALKNFKSARILHLDAYEAIRSLIPPAERRGLVLIDPPFERKDEFEMLAAQIQEWKKRWASGCYMIWYPIKSSSPTHLIFDAAASSGFARIWAGEFLMKPRNSRESFNGCGMLVLNTPYSIPERIEALSSELVSALGATEIVSSWVTSY